MNKLLRLVSWFALLAMIFSACSPAAPTVAPTEVPTQSSESEQPAANQYHRSKTGRYTGQALK